MINKLLKELADSNFSKKWENALSALFSPIPFLTIIITILSLYFSIQYKDNVLFSNLLVIISSVFGGIFGAFIKDEYDKISGKNILEKKGRSALRNLQSINTQLCNIKTWIVGFSKKIRRQEDKNILNEINRHISTIELNISAGLEDWVDIVPELKEKNQQGAEINKKYQEAAKAVFVQLLESRKELATTKDEKAEKDIKKKITDLEKQIKEIRKERSENLSNINIDPTLIGSPLSVGLQNSVSMFGLRTCQNCGKKFTPNYLSAASINDYNYCEECQKDRNDDLFGITNYGKK